MTTIVVTEDNKMYADTLATLGDFIIDYNAVKIEKINGHLVGAAGRWSSCLAFREWFESLQNVCKAAEAFPEAAHNIVYPEPHNDGEGGDSFQAIVLDPEGNLTVFEGNFATYAIDKPYAIGSGGAYALCAMDAGADGYTAVSVAMKRDVNSGGDVVELCLNDESEEEQ